ncbi:MAG: hypothetical protein MUE81_13820 [Thermoflexibacter sp.]|nr:hypothetical protein [Thermoflexibacter sp.]
MPYTEIMTRQECWNRLMTLAKRQEGCPPRLFPNKDSLKVRLTNVFEEDYNSHNYEILRKKANLLQADERKKLKEGLAPEQMWRKIKEDIDAYLPDPDTIETNFTKSQTTPREKFKNFIAIVYGKADSFEDYYTKTNRPPKGIEGVWVSIVRSHNGEELYFSEIEIIPQAEKEHTYHVEMIGKNTFKGTAFHTGGCLQLLFNNGKKVLLLSFFVSLTESPMLLQGTFSGISSKGVPIAGLELLVRPALLPEVSVPQAIRLKGEAGEKAWENLPPALKKVFYDFSKCYMVIDNHKINHFDWRDLE